MTKVLAVILAAAVLPVFAPAARAQNLDEIFRKVNPSVIVVRAKGRRPVARPPQVSLREPS